MHLVVSAGPAKAKRSTACEHAACSYRWISLGPNEQKCILSCGCCGEMAIGNWVASDAERVFVIESQRSGK